MNSLSIQKIFDYHDGKLYWKVSPARNVPIGRQAGHKTSSGYRRIGFNKKHHFEHVLIFILFNGYRPKQVDHIDGNICNNKIENLRAATASQNQYNTKISLRNASKVKNVNWHKVNKKWEVRIGVNNQRLHLGVFEDLELAELVAIEARNKYHKEFARHL